MSIEEDDDEETAAEDITSLASDATASSILGAFRPGKALDGNLDNFFHSQENVANSWFQLEFPFEVKISHLVLHNRKSCCGERFKKVSMDVGNTPAVPGQLPTNPRCAFFEGPSSNGMEHTFECDPENNQGKYLSLALTTDTVALQIGELYVFGTVGKKKRESVLQ